MSYSNTLSRYINNKHYSYKYISDKCAELGISIDPSYISKLANGKASAPSDEISIALAKILDMNERLLVLESATEKLPVEFTNFLGNLKTITTDNKLAIFENADFEDKKMKEQIIKDNKEYYNSLSIADFILDDELSVEAENCLPILINRPDENITFSINDNSMFPIINKKDIAVAEKQEQYNNGDIVLCVYNDKTIIRKYIENAKNIILVPINTEYETILDNKANVQILGKVIRVIHNIK